MKMRGRKRGPVYSTTAQAVWNRTKYSLDEEYRALRSEKNKAWRAAQSKKQKELTYLAARISYLRISIEKMQKNLEKKDRELVSLVEEREKLRRSK